MNGRIRAKLQEREGKVAPVEPTVSLPATAIPKPPAPPEPVVTRNRYAECKEWLTVDDLQALLHCSTTKANLLMRTKLKDKFGAIKQGKPWLVSRAGIEDYLSSLMQ